MSNAAHQTYTPSAADAAKNEAFVKEHTADGKKYYIQRHSLQARITHGVVVVSCILLVISGLFVFVPPLARLVGPNVVFAFRMSHRVLGVIFIAFPLVSAILAPKGAWHMFKEDFFTKWDKDDTKWIILFFPYLFLAKWMHMPDQSLNKSGQRFADGMLIILCFVMGISGAVLMLGSSVFSLSSGAHAVWLLVHDIGFFLICVFGMAHIFLGAGIFQPYRGSYKLMFGNGQVSEGDALYHWGHWARKELADGGKLVCKDANGKVIKDAAE